MKIKENLEKLKIEVPAVFLAIKRKETSIIAKMFGFLAVCYALSPIDLIPDFVPVLGYLDDLLVLPVLIWLTLKFMDKDVMEECRKEATDLWQDKKPKAWFYAIPIILFWLLILKRLFL